MAGRIGAPSHAPQPVDYALTSNWHLADGMRNQEIAYKLNLTEHTARHYLLRIYDKLDIASRVELVLYAVGRSESLGHNKVVVGRVLF